MKRSTHQHLDTVAFQDTQHAEEPHLHLVILALELISEGHLKKRKQNTNLIQQFEMTEFRSEKSFTYIFCSN